VKVVYAAVDPLAGVYRLPMKVTCHVALAGTLGGAAAVVLLGAEVLLTVLVLAAVPPGVVGVCGGSGTLGAGVGGTGTNVMVVAFDAPSVVDDVLA